MASNRFIHSEACNWCLNTQEAMSTRTRLGQQQSSGGFHSRRAAGRREERTGEKWPVWAIKIYSEKFSHFFHHSWRSGKSQRGGTISHAWPCKQHPGCPVTVALSDASPRGEGLEGVSAEDPGTSWAAWFAAARVPRGGTTPLLLCSLMMTLAEAGNGPRRFSH